MKTIILLLFCLVAGSNSKHTQDYRGNRGKDIVIENRGKIVNNGVQYKGEWPKQQQDLLQQFGYDTQNIGDNAADKDTLLKQAFVLAVLVNVNEPAIEQHLEDLSQQLVANEQQYIGGIDGDMEQVLQLGAAGQMLGKQAIFTGQNPAHVQQLKGLSKLLKQARNWDTFQRNACFARQNINDEVFVNALLLAVRDRPDTQDLVVPAVNEILPEQFYDQELLQQVQNIQPADLLSGAAASIKPQYQDIVVGAILQGSVRNPYQQQRLGGFHQQQQKKSWQEWRQEGLQKQGARGVSNIGQGNQQKAVLPVNVVVEPSGNNLNQRISYLTQDIGLNNFWYSFIMCAIGKVNLEASQTQQKSTSSFDTSYMQFQSAQHQRKQSQPFFQSSQSGGGLLYSPRRGREQDQPEITGYTSGRSSQRQGVQSIFRGGESMGEYQSYGRFVPIAAQQLRGTKLQPRKYKIFEEDQAGRRKSQSFGAARESYKPIGHSSEEVSQVDSEGVTGVQGGYSANQERLLKVNRRRQNQYAGQSMGQSSEEVSQEDSEEVTGVQGGYSANPERLLKVNSRRQNQYAGQSMGQSSEEVSQEDSEEVTGVQGGYSANQERLLKVSRRRQNQYAGQYSPQHQKQGFGQTRGILKSPLKKFGQQVVDVSEQESSEIFGQDSDETSGIRGGARGQSDRLLKVGRRRYSAQINPNQYEADVGQESSRGVFKMFGKSSKVGISSLHRQGQGWEDSTGIESQQSSEESGEDFSMQGRQSQRKIVGGKKNFGYTDSQEDSGEQRSYFGGIGKQQSSREEYDKQENVGDSRSNIGRKRIIRDISGQYGRDVDLSHSRSGELAMTTLQQLLARLQLEQLSNQLEDVLASRPGLSIKHKKQQSLQKKRQPQQQREKQQQLVSQQQEVEWNSLQRIAPTQSNEQKLTQIENTKRKYQSAVEQEIQLLLSKGKINLQQRNIQEIVGRIIFSQVGSSARSTFGIWMQLQQELQVAQQQQHPRQYDTMTDFGQQLKDPIFTAFLESLMDVGNPYSELLPAYEEEDISLSGVQLNDVKIDKLQTYFDISDADLTNAVNQQAMQQQGVDQSKIKVVPVARQQRLNHKPFTLKYDVSSTQPRRVVIRTFLGPKLNADGNELSLDESRNNFVLLDAYVAELSAGRNTIKRKSSDIDWTSPDSTPLIQIYQLVLQGIQGSIGVQLDRYQANSCRFPQRLLLPRGLPQGLPMQLYAIVTPVTQQDAQLQQQQQQRVVDNICGMGFAAIALDSQPLTFPLERKIENEKNLLVQNAILKYVTIYHDGPTNIQGV